MAFWILNKKNNDGAICSSIVSIMNFTGISKNTLYNYFSRKNKLEFENDNFRILKLKIIRSNSKKQTHYGVK